MEDTPNFSSLAKNAAVVLVEPEHAGNIGAVARVMNNLGFTDLRLVKPCEMRRQMHDGAYALAAHSQFILENAKVFATLQEAVADCHLVVGATARVRADHQHLDSIWDLSQILSGFETKNIALVFGRESSGLTNAEVDLCNRWLSIPTFGTNPSLNLSHAVALVLYEASKHFASLSNQKNLTTPRTPALSHEIENLKSHLFVLLEHVDYIKPGNREQKWSVFSDMLNTKNLSTKEVVMLRGFFSRLERALAQKNNSFKRRY